MENDVSPLNKELSTIIGQYPDAIKGLNRVGIYTVGNLLDSHLNVCVMTQQIDMEIWEEIFTELKVDYRERARPIRRLSSKKLPPLEIEQLELSQQTELHLFHAIMADFPLLTRLTLADALFVRDFSPFVLTKVVKVFRTRLTIWSQDPLIRSDEYQFLEQAGVPLNEISVSRLALPTYLERILKNFNVETIGTLASQNEVMLRMALGVNSDESIRVLTRSLKIYLAWLPTQTNWDGEIAGWSVSPIYFFQLKETTLEKIIDNLLNQISNERDKQVIWLRFGLDGRGQRTLAQVGTELGVSRERIRQMEKKGIDIIKRRKDGLVSALYARIGDEMEICGGKMSMTQICNLVMSFTEVGEIHRDSAILLLLFLNSNQFIKLPKQSWGLKNRVCLK